jgi:hypothetical protein
MPLGRITASEVETAAHYLPVSGVTGGVDHLDAGYGGGRVPKRVPRLVGYTPSEELRNASNSNNSSSLNVSSGLSTAYCAAFSPDLKRCTCNVHGDQIAVRSSRCGLDTLQHSQETQELNSAIKRESDSLLVPRLLKFNETKKRKRTSRCASFAPVTLITVASFEEYQAGTLDHILESWCGPKVPAGDK